MKEWNRLPAEKMDRDQITIKLKSLGVHVVGNSEAFALTHFGGVWVSLERGSLMEFNFHTSSNYYEDSLICEIIESCGWYLDQHDNGTGFYWMLETGENHG